MLCDQHSEENWPGIFQMNCLKAPRTSLHLVQGPMNICTLIAPFSMLAFLSVCIACSQNHQVLFSSEKEVFPSFHRPPIMLPFVLQTSTASDMQGSVLAPARIS